MNIKKLVFHAQDSDLTDSLWNASEKFRDMQFLRSWFEFDSEVDRAQARSSSMNWNAVMGLAVMAVISGTFWTGLGLLIARLT